MSTTPDKPAAWSEKAHTAAASSNGSIHDADEKINANDAVTGQQELSSDKNNETAPRGQGPVGDVAFEKEIEENYKPKTFKFWAINLSALAAMFLVALDRSIIATAIPYITNDFHSLGDIGWYGSAYMLTTAAFQLLFGRIYRFYNLLHVFLGSIFIFEVGSAICGAAPSSPVLIFGRAVAGVGSAGIVTGAMMTVIPMVPLHRRPKFQGLFGMVFGVASVAGPLVGGAFTSRVTWRWCFYMNLPIGAVAFALLFLFLKPSPKPPQPPVSIARHIMRLDPIGTVLFVPCMVCLILALQWGGSTYSWSNWRIILLFVMFGLTLIGFACVQIMMPESATIPVRVITQRSMLAAALYMFFLAGSMMAAVYYVPLWFQAVKSVSPVQSGIDSMPMVLSLVAASIMSGFLTTKIGYFVPSMLVGAAIMAVGQGLMSTFKPSSGSNIWIGFQFIAGFGTGCGMQAPSLVAQTSLSKDDIPTGISLSFFMQQVGGVVFVSVGQTILSTLLVNQLKGIDGLNPQDIVQTGATELHKVVPKSSLNFVIHAYNHAVTRIFICGLALSVAQLACALCVEWKSIKKPKPSATSEAAQEKA